MKIAKRIDMHDVSATLLVDSEKGVSGWVIHISKGGKVIRAEASSSTVLALMMADRDFKASSTKFYEVKSE